MKILITNIRVALRTGTEIVVRDFAIRLSERQHEVTVYTPTIGPLAEELAGHGITVVDNLLEAPHAPDVIHGHHLPCTAEAILAFPRAPAIWICHSSTAWFDAPPPFTQVQRMFAVDETCRTRLIESDSVPAHAIGILPNAVDLRRFPARSTSLPTRPARALSLVKHGGPEILIAEACHQAGLEFEALGHGVGQEIDDVERRCAQVDIVFATARTALEAMASGAAVVLIDGRGFGGLVTTANYELGRRLNFGLGMLKEQPTPEALINSIRAYDPLDAAAVSQRVRQDADLDHTILRLEDIYASVIKENAGRSFDPAILRREQIEFCRSWLMKLEPAGPWLEDRNNILQHYAQQIEERDNQIRSLSSQIERSERARSVRLAKALRRLIGRIPGQ